MFSLVMIVVLALVQSSWVFAAQTDECILGFPQPVCKNGGTCVDTNLSLLGTVVCTCAPGYNGTNCENINECLQSNPCQHGGVCADPLWDANTGSILTCTCPNGYTGNHCQFKDECILGTNPCKNGGVCHDPTIDANTGSSLTCTCPTGFNGTLCQYENECITANTALCLNGGTCMDNDQLTKNTVVCNCNTNAGYSGQRCQNEDECLTRPATACSGKDLEDASGTDIVFNAGTHTYSTVPLPASACYDPDVTLINTAICNCLKVGTSLQANPGISGSRCQYQNECLFNEFTLGAITSCVSTTGTCVDSDLTKLSTNSTAISPNFLASACVCKAGYSRDTTQNFPNCDLQDECITKSISCLHGGKCYDQKLNVLGSGAYDSTNTFCACPLGYFDNVYGNALNQTVNGCILENECLTVGRACQNQGNCTDPDFAVSGSTLGCVCPNGNAADNTTNPGTTIFGSLVTGDCDYMNECAQGVCKNGGNCTEGAYHKTGDFTCDCNIIAGYYGKTCAYENECITVVNACYNGGTCQDADTTVLGNFVCTCSTGYYGARCESTTPPGGDSQTSPSTTAAAPSTTAAAPSTTAGASSTTLTTTIAITTATTKAPATISSSTNYCSSNPCSAQGTLQCTSGTSTYLCQCKSLYYGRNCQNKYKTCSVKPCKNGGTCIDKSTGGFKCVCPSGFKGKKCQNKK